MQDKNVVEVNYHQTGKSTNTDEIVYVYDYEKGDK